MITLALGDLVEVPISDSCIGISNNHQSRVFDPSFTTNEAGKGTDLGLNVAYNVVGKYKGLIDVKIRDSEGTTFCCLR